MAEVVASGLVEPCKGSGARNHTAGVHQNLLFADESEVR
jgi:hypothetical protein